MSPRGGDKPIVLTQALRQARKPYQPPALKFYGNLARITESVGFMGKLDGGSVLFMRKTS